MPGKGERMDQKKVEFIESYIKVGDSDYKWHDNHGELIRCKDCRFGEKCTNGAKLPAVQCFNSDIGETGYCHEPNWYCADGERRTD